MATTASHSPFIVTSSPSPISSSISLNPLATNIEDLLSRCLPQQSTSSDESSFSPSVASCDTSPSVVDLVLSHHAPKLSSPLVSLLENNTDASEEQPQDDQMSF